MRYSPARDVTSFFYFFICYPYRDIDLILFSASKRKRPQNEQFIKYLKINRAQDQTSALW